MGYNMGYIGQNTRDLLRKNYGIFCSKTRGYIWKTMGYIMRYVGQYNEIYWLKLRYILNKNNGIFWAQTIEYIIAYIEQNRWDILGKNYSI